MGRELEMDRGWELEGGGGSREREKREKETLRIRERTPCNDREKK